MNIEKKFRVLKTRCFYEIRKNFENYNDKKINFLDNYKNRKKKKILYKKFCSKQISFINLNEISLDILFFLENYFDLKLGKKINIYILNFDEKKNKNDIKMRKSIDIFKKKRLWKNCFRRKKATNNLIDQNENNNNLKKFLIIESGSISYSNRLFKNFSLIETPFLKKTLISRFIPFCNFSSLESVCKIRTPKKRESPEKNLKKYKLELNFGSHAKKNFSFKNIESKNMDTKTGKKFIKENMKKNNITIKKKKKKKFFVPYFHVSLKKFLFEKILNKFIFSRFLGKNKIFTNSVIPKKKDYCYL